MSLWYFTFLILASYLIGSIPFSLIIAKAHGRDLRAIGSGNIGATNLSRAVGRKWGYVCFFLDCLKGFMPMLIAGELLGEAAGSGLLLLWLSVGCASIIGHIFPVYLGFKGGKGVATSFGVALGLWPYYTICAVVAVLVWLLVVLATRYISLGSMAASVVFPVTFVILIWMKSAWSLTELWPLLAAATCIPLMVILRHRANIKRLTAGTESKVFSK